MSQPVEQFNEMVLGIFISDQIHASSAGESLLSLVTSGFSGAVVIHHY